MEETLEFAGKPYPHWKKRFFTIWSGQAISMLGSQITNFAIIWYLTEQTGSATVLSIASLFGTLPAVVFSPFAGAFVDRTDRKKVMIFSDILIALTRLLGMVLFATGAIQIWHIYLMIFIGSAAGTFQHPAMTASTALMVPKQRLSRVAGMNQTLNGALNIAGPPLGALLMNLTTIPVIFLIDIITMLMAVLPLLFIPIPQPESRKDANGAVVTQTFFEDLKEGMHYVFSWPGLSLLLISAMLINFLIAPAMSLLPLLITKHFGGNEVQLALMNSVMGIGMLLGGLTLSVWGGFKKRILTAFAGMIFSGIGFAVIGFVPGDAFPIAVGAFALAAFMLPLVNGPIHAVVQASVAPEMLGRVTSLISMGAQLAMPIGLAIAGPLSDSIGIQTWFIIGGVVMSLVGIISFIIPALNNIETNVHSTGGPVPQTAGAPSEAAPK